jgi:ribosomal protein S20
MEYRVNPIEELERYTVPVNEPTGTKKVKADNFANHTKAACKTGKGGGATEVNQGLKGKKQNTNDIDTTEMKQLKKRAYKAFASDPETNEEMLQETESIIDAVAQFNLSKAKRAQR